MMMITAFGAPNVPDANINTTKNVRFGIRLMKGR